jgi:hypothetical protein
MSTKETVFSVGSVQSAYKRNKCSDRVSARAVTSQLSTEGVSPEEIIVTRFQSDCMRNRKKTL